MMKKPRISFSYKMDEKLIKLVRAHEELYDTANKKYSDTSFKNEVWKTISNLFSLDVEIIKQRWESLRSQYRKNRRRKHKMVLAIGSDVKWKYEEQLDFLQAYMKEREVVVPPQVFCEDTFVLSEDGEEALEEECIVDTTILQNNNENLPHFSSSYNSVPLTIESDIMQTEGTHRKKRRKRNSREKVFCLLKKYLFDQEKADLEENVSKDELDFFFDSVKCSVKKFSDTDKHLAKQKIFSIVSEIEANYLN